MLKTEQVCGVCGAALKFRRWSMRYGLGSRWREALAECPQGCGMWQIRYFDGLPTSKPYQVRAKAQKAARGSWRLSRSRQAAITAIYGSVQSFLDNAPLVCMSMQAKL